MDVGGGHPGRGGGLWAAVAGWRGRRLLGGGGEPVGRVGGGGKQSEGGMVAVRPRTMV